MFNRGLMASAVFSAGVASLPLAVTPSLAQSYPPPPGYSQPVQPGPYTAQPGNYAPDRRGGPDFDLLEDDDAPGNPGATSLSPPGYQQQPDYRQAPAQQTYQQQQPLPPQQGYPPQQTYQQQAVPQRGNVPQGPVMSPDDPRYGRPMNAPPLPAYSDRGPPQQQGYNAQQDGDRPLRPPGAIDSGPTGAVQPQQPGTAQGANGRSVMSALPVEEQPETGPRKELPERLRRQEVNYPTKEPAGTIIVDTPNTQLYYILGNGRAVRYGVRVGRDGFTWTGVQKVTRKAEWPDWHPPTEMIERQPYLPRFMAGGDGNPMGARAMYLGSTVYRIHGTNQPSTIGQFVSSGCIGMLNEDVTDLFDRVKVGTRVVVLPGGKPPETGPTASAQPMALNNGPAGSGAPVQSQPSQAYQGQQYQGPQGQSYQGQQPYQGQSAGGAPINAPRPNTAMGVPNQGPTVVPPLPAPVVVR